MKRSGIEAGAKSKARGSTFRHRGWRRRNPRRRKASRRFPGATGWTQGVFTLYGRTCVGCGGRATQGHHTVPRNVILGDTRKSREERAQLAYDARNGAPICADCHERHENASRRLLRSMLPEGAIVWALEHGYGHRVNDRRVYPAVTVTDEESAA